MPPSHKVMVFGSFDGLHDGHRFFLNEAAKLGSLLIVVAKDEHIRALKGKEPRRPLPSRISELRAAYPEASVVEGDDSLNSWEVIERESPEVVALGYDQKDLGIALMKAFGMLKVRPQVVIVSAHKPDKLHSSLLNS